MRIVLIICLMAGLIYLWIQAPLEVGPQPLTIEMLDVGQGDSIYLRLPNHKDVLIDTGPNDRVLSQLGQAMPFGDRTIELMILSHNHLDHIGGFKSIVERYKVDQLWLSGAAAESKVYQEMMELATKYQIPITHVAAGTVLDSDEVKLTVLFPPATDARSLPKDQHDATVVTKVNFKNFCALMTGDLAENHEKLILSIAKQLNESLNCPLLKVTHHGSANGSSAEFLAQVNPKTAIISVGAHNLYRHPASATLQRLLDIGAQIFRTDLNGNITLTSDGTDYWTKTIR